MSEATQLVRYDAMCRAITEAHQVDEVKDIRDKARAIEMYARQAQNTEAETKAREIRLRAERKCGQMLAGDAERVRAINGRPSKASTDPRLSDYGISYDQSEIIRFAKSLHPVGWTGCNMHCRQIARSFCRRNFDPAEAAIESVSRQIDFFPDTLQDRYPRKHTKGQEPVYVLRDHLTEDDRWDNIDRMRKAAVALRKHADALETETRQLFGPPRGRQVA